ncbi:MAG: hypothetical protein R3360_04270 [Alphaproteobacteria bacterium]|nr:hypothetical protein [Alphaproteobacteria bacterium]
MQFLSRFARKNHGLVTLEWVGVAAIVLIAGLAITFLVMEGTDGTAQQLNAASTTVGDTAEAQADIIGAGQLGDGQNSAAE